MATDDKYDRQLRLWGAHGQQALMASKVCVLGSSPVATETMKNLVLPGIGEFVIVDSAKVEDHDLGNNFFLEESDLGKPRAEAVCRSLQELNPDVAGSAVVKDANQVIAEGESFFSPFALVIGCQLTEAQALKLAEVCEQLCIGLVLLTSVGFIAKLRLCFKEHTMVETKPDNDLGDLRCTDPFPELRRFADSVDLASLDDAEHAHVPYVIVLMKAIDEFRRREPQKSLPSTKDEKEQFRKIIAGMQRSPQEANFSEALDNAYKGWVPYRIPDEAQEVLRLETSSERQDFWVVARAIAQFVRDCGKLPLAGTLPDMTASTDMYMRLQEIYCSRAEGDAAAISAHVATIQEEKGGSRTGISQDFIKRFCKNALHCQVLRARSLADELRPCSPDDGGLDLAAEGYDEDSLAQWYIALRAADRIRQEHGHWPGEVSADTDAPALAAELERLTSAAGKIVSTYEAEGFTADPKVLEEIVRYGGSELQVCSSVIGGVAAQEAVKLLTKQFVPLNNTLLYDGLHAKMQTLDA